MAARTASPAQLATDIPRNEAESPHQLAFDLHPYLDSIEAIAKEHGLHHDSGVSISSASGRRKKHAGASSSSSQATLTSATTSGERPTEFTLSGSGSSGSLKRPNTSTPEGREARDKKVTESPGVTGGFNAREETWSDVARKLKPFGDTLRHDRLRSTLGESSLAKDVVGILAYSAGVPRDNAALYEAQIEMMRILANLCIDHDENRERLLSEGAPQAVLDLVHGVLTPQMQAFSADFIQLLRTAAGALLNLQLDHVSTREALRQEPKHIHTLLCMATDQRIYRVGDWYRPQADGHVSVDEYKRHISTGSRVSSWAWRIVQDVCSDVADEEGEASSNAKSEDDQKAIDSLVRGDTLSAINFMLLPFSYLLTPPQAKTEKGAWTAEDVSDLMETDMEILQVAAELIESCSLDSQRFRLAALQDLPPLPRKPKQEADAAPSQSRGTMLEFLVHFADAGQPPEAWSTDRQDSENLPPRPSDTEGAQEVRTNFARAKAALSRAIVCTVGEDANMTKLFQGQGAGQGGWFTETMMAWMKRDAKARNDLVSTAMLAVGNLARKDEHCIALVQQHHLVPKLSELLSPTADVKVSHGIMCLLKNLAIPPSNKTIIAATPDLINRVEPFLGPDMVGVQPLQFAAVGLLKHLCAGNAENAQRFVASSTFDALLELLRRTDDVPTRMEGTRVIVNAVKPVWASGGDGDNTANREARQKLTQEPVTLSLAEMVKSSTKYPVLVNEGIIALTLISSENAAKPQKGAQLVAAALQSSSPLPRKSSGAPDDESRTSKGAGSPDSSSKDKFLAPQPKFPQRQTTLDTLASNSPQSLPAPRSAADMIGVVLSRRDARMPPQFANNACTLIETLVKAAQSAKSASVGGDGDGDVGVFSRLLRSCLPALEHLSRIGPEESLNVAQRTLQNVKDVLQ